MAVTYEIIVLVREKVVQVQEIKSNFMKCLASDL